MQAFPSLSRMSKITILKLGGSAITDKKGKCVPNVPAIQHVADQLSEYKDPLILIHGGGSYAHPFVTESRLTKGLRDRNQLHSISETEFYLGQLTRIIYASLLVRSIFCVPLHPMSLATLNSGTVREFRLDPIRRALKAGLVPLLHGDLVFDESKGIGILSGDRIASIVGLGLGDTRVLFGCDVDGVYLANPRTQRDAALMSDVNPRNFSQAVNASKSPSGDATGGMGAKVRVALSLAKEGRECYIFNLKEKNALKKILSGTEMVGTRFVPWRRTRRSAKRPLQKA
jgi:isopentenyl phosphate kinase